MIGPVASVIEAARQVIYTSPSVDRNRAVAKLHMAINNYDRWLGKKQVAETVSPGKFKAFQSVPTVGDGGKFSDGITERVPGPDETRKRNRRP